MRRKRTPKIDDNIDGQKVKRRKSEMNMKQQQDLPTPTTTTEKKIIPIESNKVNIQISFQILFIYFL